MKKAKGSNGFTLIELLVVISIIAVLLSVLIPSLSKARELAQRNVCSSNLKQIGLAFKSYESEYRTMPLRVAWGHWPFGGQVFFKDGDTKKPFPAGFAALFDRGYLSFDEKSYRFLYCPTNRKFSYEEIFKLYQMPEGQLFCNPAWPNGLNYEYLYAGYCYWGGFPVGPNNVVLYPELTKVMVTTKYDRGDRVLTSDLTVTNPEARGDVYTNAHKRPHEWSSHVRSGTVLGGTTLYNDLSVRWMHMREKQENWKQHVWRWRGPSSELAVWF